MIIVEAPRLRLSKFFEVLETAKQTLKVVDFLSIPDVPFSKPDASPCLLLSKLSDSEVKRAIPVISAGHRDHISNVSMVKSYVALGANATLVVQGDGRISKASELIKYASKLIKTGSVFNAKTYNDRITAGASFFVTQLFPTIDELKRVRLQEQELYLSYFLSDKAGYARLAELGLRVPDKVYERPDSVAEYIISEVSAAKRLLPISGIYLVLSYSIANWEKELEKVTNNLKQIGL